MKIAIASKNNWRQISGHAGKVHDWLVFDCEPGAPLPLPRRVVLDDAQLPHHFKDDGPHPLHGVDIVVAASAGEGYVRHMKKWGTEVLLTGESEPLRAAEQILAGATLPDARFDITTALCKLRDLWSAH